VAERRTGRHEFTREGRNLYQKGAGAGQVNGSMLWKVQAAHGVRWPWYHAAHARCKDDIGRSEYPTSAGLSSNHSFAHNPRLFCLKEPPLTGPSDKAPIFLPYLCYLRAFGRCSPPAITQPNFSSVFSSADSLHQLRSFLHGVTRPLVTSSVVPAWASAFSTLPKQHERN
jgi:hypothetical protein